MIIFHFWSIFECGNTTQAERKTKCDWICMDQNKMGPSNNTMTIPVPSHNTTGCREIIIRALQTKYWAPEKYILGAEKYFLIPRNNSKIMNGSQKSIRWLVLVIILFWSILIIYLRPKMYFACSQNVFFLGSEKYFPGTWKNILFGPENWFDGPCLISFQFEWIRQTFATNYIGNKWLWIQYME